MSEESSQQPDLESTTPTPPEGTDSPNGDPSSVSSEAIDPASVAPPAESDGAIVETPGSDIVVADSGDIVVADSDTEVPAVVEVPVTLDPGASPAPETLTGVASEAIAPDPVPVPPPPVPTTAPQVKAQPSNLDKVLEVLKLIWRTTAPILRTIAIFLLRTALDLSKFGLVLLNAPEPDGSSPLPASSPIPADPNAPASSQKSSTASGPAKVLEDIWRVVLGLVRSRLPDSLRDRTPDRVLSVFVTGVLVLVLWLTSGLWLGKPKPAVVKPAEVDKPVVVKQSPPLEKVPPVVKAPPVEKGKPPAKGSTEKVKPVEKVPSPERVKPVEKAPVPEKEAPIEKVPPVVKAPAAEKPVPVEIAPSPPPAPVPVVPIATAPETPSESAPAPVSPPPPVPAKPPKQTPEQKRLVAVKDQLMKVTDRYKEQLVQTVQMDEKRDRLAVTLGAGWFGLDAAQQDSLAADLFKQAQKLKFSQLEIQDSTHTVLARNPVTGTGMIILQRTTFQSSPNA